MHSSEIQVSWPLWSAHASLSHCLNFCTELKVLFHDDHLNVPMRGERSQHITDGISKWAMWAPVRQSPKHSHSTLNYTLCPHNP